MKCEICQKGDAKVAIHKTVDGVEKELYVCQQCADEASAPKKASKTKKTEVKLPGGMPDPAELISGILKQIIGANADAAIVENPTAQSFGKPCPTCGMTAADFKRTSRLGCPDCYNHFASSLAPLIRDMHSGNTHAGKIPAKYADSKKGRK